MSNLPDLKTIIKVPTYSLTLPSTGRKISYRPFLVREEKALMIARLSEEPDTIVATLDSLVRACTFDNEGLDTLSVQDYEYLVIQMGAKAKGETISLRQPCKEPVPITEENPEGTCGKIIPIVCNLSDIQVEHNPDHKKTIVLDETSKTSIIMRDPRMGDVAHIVFDAGKEGKMLDPEANMKLRFQMALSCIESVVVGEEVYDAKVLTKEWLNEFLDSLPSGHLRKISQYIDTMPKTYLDVKYECPCGKVKDTIRIEGLQRFLA